MKKIVSLALIATTLAVSAQAVILGFDAGYLIDAEEEFISARLGREFKADASLSHQLEAEIGITSMRDAGLKGDILPVMINYRAESVAANKLGFHFGVGAGFARTSVSGFGVSDDGTSFAAQAFTGLGYQVSPSAKLHLGVKYLWIDDVKLFGTSLDVGDDVAVSAGISFRF